MEIILKSAPIAIICLVTETKGQMFHGIPIFYLTTGAVAVTFSTHLLAVKWEGFTTASTREIQLGIWPATQLTRPPYFRQIVYGSPLRMSRYVSERGLLFKV